MHKSYASGEFWRLYHRLAAPIQQAADKQFAIFERNPAHPSLHLKQVGAFWSARVNQEYRVLAVREGRIFYWFWIGDHDEYERLIS